VKAAEAVWRRIGGGASLRPPLWKAPGPGLAAFAQAGLPNLCRVLRQRLARGVRAALTAGLRETG